MNKIENYIPGYLLHETFTKGGENRMYWVTGVLGLALVAAPFVLGYRDNAPALWTSLIVGGTVVIASFIERTAQNMGRWEYWVALMAGLVAFLAPIFFNFGALTLSLWTMMIIGIVLAVAAGSKLYYGKASFK